MAGILMALAAIGGAQAATTPSPFPPDSVLLLVAPWCAPCHGELARADTLATAARPHVLRVMAMEDGPRTRLMTRRVAAMRWEPDADTTRRAREAVLDRAAGLPYGIATDRNGRICGEHRGGLDVENVRKMVARCRT